MGKLKDRRFRLNGSYFLSEPCYGFPTFKHSAVACEPLPKAKERVLEKGPARCLMSVTANLKPEMD